MQETIILTLNNMMASSPLLITLIPILGDVFVFSYPIYLIYLYFSHPENMSRWKKIFHISEEKTQKNNALTIFFAAATGVIMNYIIKFFVTEQRPYHVIELAVNPKESLILNSIPTDSFPSDHASVGMSIALTTLILGYRYHNTQMIKIGWIFIAFTLIMNISRITIGVHRPADIIWGMGVGIIAALLLTYAPVYHFLTKKIYTPVMRFQEYIFGKIMK